LALLQYRNDYCNLLFVSLKRLFPSPHIKLSTCHFLTKNRTGSMVKERLIKSYFKTICSLHLFGMAAVVFVTTSMLTWLPTYFEKMRMFHRKQPVKWQVRLWCLPWRKLLWVVSLTDGEKQKRMHDSCSRPSQHYYLNCSFMA